jgi:hypothetical protein
LAVAAKLEAGTEGEEQGDRFTRQDLSLQYTDDDVLKGNVGLTVNLALLASSQVLDVIPPQYCQIKASLTADTGCTPTSSP